MDSIDYLLSMTLAKRLSRRANYMCFVALLNLTNDEKKEYFGS
jgi:hypothetical protein